MTPTDPASSAQLQGLGEVLAWDSDFFGVRIGRVLGASLDPEAATPLLSWARANDVRCVYFLAGAGEEPSHRVAEQAGFRPVDVRLRWGRSLEGLEPPGAQVAPIEARDVPQLLDLARSSHRATRFYHDPNFPDERCDALYARWVERGVEDPEQEVLTVRKDGEPQGYIVCARPNASAGAPGTVEPTGDIGLIAVRPEAHRSGLGGSLVRGGMAWLREQGSTRVEVVSQGRNDAATRLYESQGFELLERAHWFHLWLDEVPQ